MLKFFLNNFELPGIYNHVQFLFDFFLSFVDACEFADCGEDFDCKATLSGHTCIPSKCFIPFRR